MLVSIFSRQPLFEVYKGQRLPIGIRPSIRLFLPQHHLDRKLLKMQYASERRRMHILKWMPGYMICGPCVRETARLARKRERTGRRLVETHDTQGKQGNRVERRGEISGTAPSWILRRSEEVSKLQGGTNQQLLLRGPPGQRDVNQEGLQRTRSQAKIILRSRLMQDGW